MVDVVDSTSSTSIETVTVDSTVSVDTPIRPVSASNIDEQRSSSQTVRPSSFTTILPAVSSDNGIWTAPKDICDGEDAITRPGSRGRCRSADRQVLGDGKVVVEHAGN